MRTTINLDEQLIQEAQRVGKVCGHDGIIGRRLALQEDGLVALTESPGFYV